MATKAERSKILIVDDETVNIDVLAGLLMLKSNSHFLVMLAAAVLVFVGPGAVLQISSQNITDAEVKAALMFKFPIYVRWPDKAKADFTCCVLGNDRIADLMSDFDGETLMGKTICVERVSGIESLEKCQMLFIGTPGKKTLSDILQAIGTKPILTVGDSKGFAENGGIINFILTDGSVRFEINPQAGERAGLKISSKLLQLATIVEDR